MVGTIGVRVQLAAFERMGLNVRRIMAEAGVPDADLHDPDGVLPANAVRKAWELADREWAVGERYSVVDGYLLVFYRWGNRQKMDVRSLASTFAEPSRMSWLVVSDPRREACDLSALTEIEL